MLAADRAGVAMGKRHSDSLRLQLPGGGALQVGISFSDEHSDLAVVYVHGFGSTRVGQKADALEAACARRGWTFASFDFRGHGQSTGTLLDLRGTSLLEDLEVVRAYLAGRGIVRLCPVGSSMGGWVSAWFTLRQPQSVPACVLIAPALDFLRSRWALATESEREQWQRTRRLRVRSDWVDAEIGYGIVEEIDQFPVQKLAKELARPVLIFHGMKDDVVPYQHSLTLAERAFRSEVELRLYSNGDHRLLDYADEMAESACVFIGRNAGPASNPTQTISAPANAGE
jgi:pimeloyl-ACP methyl ester carboxylesterase